jgi:hypothetical protein
VGGGGGGGFFFGVAAKADPLTAKLKATPETMEMARLLIWESPEATILPSENGIHRCPSGVFRRLIWTVVNLQHSQ